MGSRGGDGRRDEKIGRGDGGNGYKRRRVFRRRRWVVEEEMGGGGGGGEKIGGECLGGGDGYLRRSWEEEVRR